MKESQTTKNTVLIPLTNRQFFIPSNTYSSPLEPIHYKIINFIFNHGIQIKHSTTTLQKKNPFTVLFHPPSSQHPHSSFPKLIHQTNKKSTRTRHPKSVSSSFSTHPSLLPIIIFPTTITLTTSSVCRWELLAILGVSSW